MTNTKLAIVGLLTLFLTASFVPAARASVESDKTRDKIVELATKLENDPLSKKARSRRKEVLTLLKSAPELRVDPCRAVLGDLLLSKKLGAQELYVQLEISTAKYIAEHPDVTGDRERAILGGLEGVLRTYEAMQIKYPFIEIETMQYIIERRENGELADYVREALANCNP